MAKATATINAYHKWLGISPKDQPPNYYRLLALDLFESDADVIANAADQRMMLVRSFQQGENVQLSQQLLNEVAAARVCLLSPERKADYDRRLQLTNNRPDGSVRRVPSRPSAPVPSQISVALAAPIDLGGRAVTRKRQRSTAQRLPVKIGFIVICGLAVLIPVLWLLISGSSSKSDKPRTVQQVNVGSGGNSAALPLPKETHPMHIATKPVPLKLQHLQAQTLGEKEVLRRKVFVEKSSEPTTHLRFSLSADAPSGARIDSESGTLTWLPSEAQQGQRHLFHIRAVDGVRTAQTDFEVNVAAARTNLKELHIRSVPEQTATAGSPFEVVIALDETSSPDSPVQFSLVSGPQGASVDPANGKLTWQAPVESAGETFEAKISAADSTGRRADTLVKLKVAAATTAKKEPGPANKKHPTDSRLPVPGLTEQQAAAKTIRQLFADNFHKAQSSRDARRELASKLLSEGDATRDDNAGRFVLYREAAELAKSAEDVPLYLKVVEALGRSYVVDTADIQQKDLIELSKSVVRNEQAARELVSALLGVLDVRIQQEEWKDSVEILKAAQGAAVKARDADLRKHVTMRSREITVLTKAHDDSLKAAEALAGGGGNAAAHGAVGLYQGLVLNNWQSALPRLAQGDDETLASAARNELAGPVGAEKQKALGDLWLGVATGKSGNGTVKKLIESSPTVRRNTSGHAAMWYKEALTEATGLTKRAIELQLSELQAIDPAEPSGTSRCKGGFSQIIDNNGATGFTLHPSSNDWIFTPNPMVPGYLTTVHYNGVAGGSGAKRATWAFTGLAPGKYQVSVTWTANTNRATNAPYTILDNTKPLFLNTINQQNPPAANFVVSGVNFQNLGTPVAITSGKLIVQLTDKANGFVIADAVRIECVP